MPGSPVWANAGPFKDSWAHISPSEVLLRWLPVTLGAQQALLFQSRKQDNYRVFWSCEETSFMRRHILLYIQPKKFSILSSDECICCRKVRKGLAAKFALLVMQDVGDSSVEAHKPRKAFNQWTKNLKPQKTYVAETKDDKVLCQYNYVSRSRFFQTE